MDILDKAHKLETRIARTVDRAAQQFLKSEEREPLEVMHRVVDAIEEEVRPAGRGTHVFPFNRIKVSVVAATRDARARFEAVFSGEPSLQARIMERLESAACDVSDLVVKIVYVTEAREDWPHPDRHIEFDRVNPAAPAPQPPAAPARIKLTVVTGVAEQPQYSFSLARIDLGRCAEIRDRRNHLIRTNHVAFADSETLPNRSVSRRHAHIHYAADLRQYRVYDDRSEQGTGIVRGGKTIAVPSGARGVRLHSGDEIVLGEARVRVTFGEV